MKTKILSTSEYLAGILSSDKMILGKAITLIESSLPEHQIAAEELLAACKKHVGPSIRLGITGVPGVGKSTFIEAFGKYLVHEQKLKVGVLAIDPSSDKSKGSILGDKTRMQTLSTLKEAYVRPSPSSGTLGGVRQTTRNTITLLEAAGYDVILIETVGVGQSETLVHSMVDFFLLLMLAGAGDSLQGIKKGIMEMADLMVINKADGNNLEPAKKACREYQMALSMLAPTRQDWKTRMHYCSALEENRMDLIWKTVEDFQNIARKNGSFEQNRKEQVAVHFKEDWQDTILQHFSRLSSFPDLYRKFEERVLRGELTSRQASKELFELLNSQNKA